jgi:hypothetical protein
MAWQLDVSLLVTLGIGQQRRQPVQVIRIRSVSEMVKRSRRDGLQSPSNNKTFHRTRSLNPRRPDENFAAQQRCRQLIVGGVHAVSWVGGCGNN